MEYRNTGIRIFLTWDYFDEICEDMGRRIAHVCARCLCPRASPFFLRFCSNPEKLFPERADARNFILSWNSGETCEQKIQKWSKKDANIGTRNIHRSWTQYGLARLSLPKTSQDKTHPIHSNGMNVLCCRAKYMHDTRLKIYAQWLQNCLLTNGTATVQEAAVSGKWFLKFCQSN